MNPIRKSPMAFPTRMGITQDSREVEQNFQCQKCPLDVAHSDARERERALPLASANRELEREYGA